LFIIDFIGNLLSSIGLKLSFVLVIFFQFGVILVKQLYHYDVAGWGINTKGEMFMLAMGVVFNFPSRYTLVQK